MATKSANLYARIEPTVKEQAEIILSSLGISASNAISMFYKQIILQNGIPFDIKLPSPRIPNLDLLSEKELSEELQKGFSNLSAGKVTEAKTAFAKIQKGV